MFLVVILHVVVVILLYSFPKTGMIACLAFRLPRSMLSLDVFVPAEREGTSFSSILFGDAYASWFSYVSYIIYLIYFFDTFFIVIDSRWIIGINTCKSCFSFFIQINIYLANDLTLCRIALYIRLVRDFRLLRNKM